MTTLPAGLPTEREMFSLMIDSLVRAAHVCEKKCPCNGRPPLRAEADRKGKIIAVAGSPEAIVERILPAALTIYDRFAESEKSARKATEAELEQLRLSAV